MKQHNQTHPHQCRSLRLIIAISNAIVLGVFLLAFGGAANAQTVASQDASTSAVPASSSTTDRATSAPSKTDAPAADPAGSYTDSLKQLSALYEQQAQKLAQENEKLKQLYADGLVSRNDLEAGEKSLADARARVDATQKEIATANLKPAPVAIAPANGFTNQSWTTGNLTIDNLVRYYGKQNGVDPYLIFCLMHQESGFASRVVSPKGAQGLMQLMPGTAARYGVTNPFDAAQSISAGTRYLKDLLQMFGGRVDLALAGYNAGEGAVIKYGYQIPPYSETRNYVRLITMRYGMNAVVIKKS